MKRPATTEKEGYAYNSWFKEMAGDVVTSSFVLLNPPLLKPAKR